MTKGTPVEETINSCNDLIQFQKIVKLSDKYTYVEHECGGRTERKAGVRVIKTIVEYGQRKRYLFKSYRVFASKDPNDGRILKGGGARGKLEKFGGTPDHCFIYNDTVENITCPERLDREWYIQQAKERLKGFGVVVR
jgi:DNA polymerase